MGILGHGRHRALGEHVFGRSPKCIPILAPRTSSNGRTQSVLRWGGRQLVGPTVRRPDGFDIGRLIALCRVVGWWVADYAYAAVWQVRGLFNRTDPETFRSGERAPIVVVPGIWESWKFLQPLITSMNDQGHPVHVVQHLHLNGRPVADAARLVDSYLEDHGLDDAILVAHSKGGLIGKFVMVHGHAAPRVRAMLAVAAPFSGSAYARWMLVPSLRSFSPGNAVIVSLAREQAVNARIVSVFGRFDPHIPGGSYLAGAKNVRLETGGHFRVLAHPRLIAELALLSS